jgi:hypothetical protein
MPLLKVAENRYIIPGAAVKAMHVLMRVVNTSSRYCYCGPLADAVVVDLQHNFTTLPTRSTV